MRVGNPLRRTVVDRAGERCEYCNSVYALITMDTPLPLKSGKYIV